MERGEVALRISAQHDKAEQPVRHAGGLSPDVRRGLLYLLQSFRSLSAIGTPHRP